MPSATGLALNLGRPKVAPMGGRTTISMRRNLAPRKPAGQRYPHHFFANLSVLPVPIVHLLCCTMYDQRGGTKPQQVQITILRWQPQGD